ncbi:MAG TPA: DUF5916 domain-containing protein, partial [Vicinamibacteria bacterium]
KSMQHLLRVAGVVALLFPWDASAEVVTFADGTRLSVQSYELKGNLVVMRTLNGKLQSVPRSYVDLEATAGINGSPKPIALPPQSVANDPPPSPRPDSTTTSPTLPTPPPGGDGMAPRPPSLPHEAVATASPAPAFSPPPPSAPEVMARDQEGRITVRATRLVEPIVLDGKLDDPVYSQVKAITGFIQQEPHEGQPATESTDVWLLFDDRNFYIAGRCWDSHPERMVANEMRRDNNNIFQNENISVNIDTLYDRRNGFYFQTNPLGAIRDQAIGDEGQTIDGDWNTVWDVKASVFDRGWIFEMAIPFKSLRFRQEGPQTWGMNVRRIVTWKNERSFLAPIPASYGSQGIHRFSEAATVVGVEIPGSTRNLELKPYGVSTLTTDQTADEPYSNDPDADAGFDVKYGLTRGLIADFTYNTDFAQIEEDQQQVNLTRFRLLFPEKRDFFLEGQSIFSFGGARILRGGGSARPGVASADLAPFLFFSRRIGITDDGIDPIRVGGRVTGRAGPYRIGALNIQTRGVEDTAIPATNFSVFRLRRDILRRSDIGVIVTHRNTSLTEGASSNSVLGVDGNFALHQNLDINTYYAVSRTPLSEGGLVGDDDASYLGNFTYSSDRYGLILEHLYVGEHFRPELGFLRREAFRRNYALARFSPRPRSIEAIRRFAYEGEFDYITDPGGRLETQRAQAAFRIEFENSNQARVEYTNYFEFLPEEFEISDDVILPVAEYRFQDLLFLYSLGPQAFLPSTMTFRTGSFFSGDRTEVTFNGRVEVTPQFSLEPNLTVNWVDLAEGSFTQRLASVRVNYTFTPRAFVSSLIQYNSSSDSLSSNLRFRWEYEPGSDLFVVYSEGRDELSADPFLANRTFAVKFTKLFRF